MDVSVRTKAVIKGRLFAFFGQGLAFLCELDRPDFRYPRRLFEVVLSVVGRFNGHFPISSLLSIMAFFVCHCVRYVHVARGVIRVSRGFLVNPGRGSASVVDVFSFRQVCQ